MVIFSLSCSNGASGTTPHLVLHAWHQARCNSSLADASRISVLSHKKRLGKLLPPDRSWGQTKIFSIYYLSCTFFCKNSIYDLKLHEVIACGLKRDSVDPKLPVLHAQLRRGCGPHVAGPRPNSTSASVVACTLQLTGQFDRLPSDATKLRHVRRMPASGPVSRSTVCVILL